MKRRSFEPPPLWRWTRMAWRESSQRPRRLQRVPEPMAVMDENDQVEAFHREGAAGGSLPPIYHFNARRMGDLTPLGGFVVDLGSGSGQYLRVFAKHRPDVQVLGLELADRMIALGRRDLRRAGLATRVKLLKQDMTTFRIPPHPAVRLVSSVFALHHLSTRDDLKRCLENVARVREEHGAGVWIFDHALPRHPDTPAEYARLAAPGASPVLLQDSQHSLGAAWTFEELSQMLDETRMGPFAHERAQLLMGAYQFHSLPPKGLGESRRSLRLDVRIAEIHAQTSMEQIAVTPAARLASLARMIFRIGAAVFRWGLRQFIVNLFQRGRRVRIFQASVARVLANELGRLKGPLMKLGQIAGQTAPRLRADTRRTLGALVDTSATLRPGAIRSRVENSLQRPLGAVFSDWSDEAFASGVVAQVHFARLKDGSPVAVKVRYPGLLQAVDTDLKLIQRILPLLRVFFGLTNPTEVFGEVKTLVLGECDLLREARHQMAFRKIFKNEDGILIPRVYPDLCRTDLLVTEFCDGERFYDFVDRASQEEKNRAGTILWRFVAKSLNEHCMFNADPHPGNYLFADGKVVFLDFGFTKRWSQEFIQQTKRLSLAIAEGHLGEFSEALMRLGFVGDELQFDFEKAYEAYRDTTTLPWRADRLFRFTDQFASHHLNDLVDKLSQAGPVRMPEDFVAYSRTYWGLYTVLARLKAEANWHRLTLPILKAPARRPPPF